VNHPILKRRQRRMRAWLREHGFYREADRRLCGRSPRFRLNVAGQEVIGGIDISALRLQPYVKSIEADPNDPTKVLVELVQPVDFVKLDLTLTPEKEDGTSQVHGQCEDAP
jgi:hypothetical protein